MTVWFGGGVVGDAAGEDGAGDGPVDAVGVGSAVDASGVGAVGDADGDVGACGAPGVGTVDDADGEGAAGDASVAGAAGDAPTVRVLQVMGAGLRIGGRWWFWAVASVGGGRCWSVSAPVLAVLVASGDAGASSRHSGQRVPLVLLMVRVVYVMVLMTLMVLPRVGALWALMLQVDGVVAGDFGAEGVVVDAPGDANAAGVASDALVYGVACVADCEGGVGGALFCGAAGDDDGEGAAGGCSGCVSARVCG